MRRRHFVILAVALILCVQEASAWGTWVHRLITATAERHLEPEVKAKAERYLGSSIVEHCSWMDEIRKPLRSRKHPQFNECYPFRHTLDWHMITVDERLQISDKRAFNNDGDLLPNLKVCIQNLKNHRNLSDSAVVVNLKCILHMVEDMHCPSHIFYTEFPDCFWKEGTPFYRWDCFEITYDGKPLAYHTMWDKLAISELYPEFEGNIERYIEALDTLSSKREAKMCQGSIEEWAVETAKDCRPIYDWAAPGANLDRNFLLKHRKLSVQQFHRAAYRLAHILNECFK